MMFLNTDCIKMLSFARILHFSSGVFSGQLFQDGPINKGPWPFMASVCIRYLGMAGAPVSIFELFPNIIPQQIMACYLHYDTCYQTVSSESSQKKKSFIIR